MTKIQKEQLEKLLSTEQGRQYIENILQQLPKEQQENLLPVLPKFKLEDSDPKFIEEIDEVLTKCLELDQKGIPIASIFETLLDTKSNNPKKYSEFVKLIDDVRDDIVPPAILRNLDPKKELSHKIQKLIEQKRNGVNSLIKPFNTNKEALKNSKYGDVVCVEDCLFFRSKNGLKELQIDEKTFNELFPPLEIEIISQGNIGNCYMVAPLYALMQKPAGREKVFSMFKKVGNDIHVSIPGQKPLVIFKNGEISYSKDQGHLYGAKGIQMLEIACVPEDGGHPTAVIDFITGGSSKIYNYTKKIADKPIPGKKIINDLIEIIEEQNFTPDKKEEMKQIVQQIVDYIIYDHSIIREIKSTIENKTYTPEIKKTFVEMYKSCIIMVNNDPTFYKNRRNLGDILKKNKDLEFLNNSSKENIIMMAAFEPNSDILLAQHSYYLKSFDPRTQTIELVNPHNTAYSIRISLSDFRKSLSHLEYIKL